MDELTIDLVDMDVDLDERKPAAKPTIKVLKQVSPQLQQPPNRNIATTQRATLYAMKSNRGGSGKDVRQIRFLSPLSTKET